MGAAVRVQLPARRPHAGSGQADVERLLTLPRLSPKVSVSGHVYDIATGRITTTADARYPGRPAGSAGQ